MNPRNISANSIRPGAYTHISQLGDEIIDSVAEVNPLMREVNADSAGRIRGGKGMSQGVMATYMVTTAGKGGRTLPQ